MCLITFHERENGSQLSTITFRHGDGNRKLVSWEGVPRAVVNGTIFYHVCIVHLGPRTSPWYPDHADGYLPIIMMPHKHLDGTRKMGEISSFEKLLFWWLSVIFTLGLCAFLEHPAAATAAGLFLQHFGSAQGGSSLLGKLTSFPSACWITLTIDALLSAESTATHRQFESYFLTECSRPKVIGLSRCSGAFVQNFLKLTSM